MRPWQILGVVLAGLAMTGCSGPAVSTSASSAKSDQATSDQTKSDQTKSDQTTSDQTKSDQTTSDQNTSDQIVFMVMTHGGRMPAVFQALASPELVVYQDGRVLTIAEDRVADLVPARYDVADIGPAAVASFVSDVEARGIVSPGTDFGTPRVADAPTTTVLLRATNGQGQVDPYALGFDTGLTEVQRSARAALNAVIDRARALTAGATLNAYSPDRVIVYEVDPRFLREEATKGWPGPSPSSFMRPSDTRGSVACGELSAGPAQIVYQAALGNSGGLWLLDGTTRTLAVNPVPLPDGCP